MADFAANLLPIPVPTLSSATADNIARFQAEFTSNIVATGNSALYNYLAVKNTDFFTVGDLPTFSNLVIGFDADILTALKERPTATLDVSWADLDAKLDELAALVAPTAPTLLPVSADVPSLEASRPTIALPTIPSSDVGAPPSGAPNIVEPTLPEAPLITLPNVPTFSELKIPDAPNISLPEWSAVAPQNLLAPPTNQFAYVDPGYVSVLHDPLVQKLLDDLENGSYGIEPADEDRLWARARDRAAQQARVDVDEAVRRATASSFPIPQGAMLDSIAQAQAKGQAILSEANREIALRRSELYVQGRKFTIEQVQGYERIRIDLYNATQERALNYAKALSDVGIQLYDASVRNFQAQLDAYKTEATVFGERIRGELAKAEVFKTQVEAEKVRGDFDRLKVELYNAQLQGITTTVELYKSRIFAANAFMQVQAQRLDVYRSTVQAYAERVRAKEAEYNIYLAAVKGQMANIDIYKAEIDAYNARLSGIKARSDVLLQSNEALLQAYKTASADYSNRLASFAKQIDARIDEAKTRTIVYAGEIDAYKAYVASLAIASRSQVDVSQQFLDAQTATFNSSVEKVKFRLKELSENVALQKDVNKGAMDFLTAALGATASGLNALGAKVE